MVQVGSATSVRAISRYVLPSQAIAWRPVVVGTVERVGVQCDVATDLRASAAGGTPVGLISDAVGAELLISVGVSS